MDGLGQVHGGVAARRLKQDELVAADAGGDRVRRDRGLDARRQEREQPVAR